MATSSDATISALQNQANSLSKSLSDSSTAYAPNTNPTNRDVSNDTSLASVNTKLDTLKSTALRNEWYGPTTTTNAGDVPADSTSGNNSGGWMMSGFKALQRPMNAVAGAIQYGLGKGTQSSLVGNVNNAMNTGLDFGDILTQEGAPRAVQIPLGFALDVMMDPVNWATAGSEALIPRIGMGIVRGGLEKAAIEGGADVAESGIRGAVKAATTGLTSNVEKKAAIIMRYLPFAKNIPGYSDLATNIGEKAVAGAEKYDALVGSDVYDRLGKGIFGQPSGIIGNTAENLVRKIPSVDIMGKSTPTGDQIADFFKYSTQTSNDVADLKDQVTNLAKSKGIILVRDGNKAMFQNIDDAVKAGQLPNLVKGSVDDAISNANDTLTSMRTPISVTDSFTNAQKLLEAAGEDYNLQHLTTAYKEYVPGQIGVQWYDNAIAKLKTMTVDDALHGHLGSGDLTAQVQSDADNLVKTWNSYDTYKDLKPLKGLLDAQQSLLSVYKVAKVPMNIGSHVTAQVGNFFMGAMMGLPMSDPEYILRVSRASDLLHGKLGAQGLKDIFFNDANSMVDLLSTQCFPLVCH